MSETEVIDLAISSTEVRSLSEVIAIIVQALLGFAQKYGVADQFDAKRMEEDLAIFLVRRRVVNLTELRATILEGGDLQLGDTIRGNRKADLLIRLHYKEGVYRR